MFFLYGVLVALSMVLTGCAIAQKVKPFEIGDLMTDITLRDQDGKPQLLTSFKGNRLVIYFYPKDSTPGCTKQACSLRDSYEVFRKNKIHVIGINYESPAHHKAFKKKYKLPFMLLSDPDKQVAKKFGAYGGWARWFFPRRMTILVDEHGVITDIIQNVDVTTHTRAVLEKLGITDDRI